jgi:hypothetical protein
MVVVGKIIFANLQESSSRGKTVHRRMQLLFRKGVEDKVHSSTLCLCQDELLE